MFKLMNHIGNTGPSIGNKDKKQKTAGGLFMGILSDLINNQFIEEINQCRRYIERF